MKMGNLLPCLKKKKNPVCCASLKFYPFSLDELQYYDLLESSTSHITQLL
jgi:hypothetical protein